MSGISSQFNPIEGLQKIFEAKYGINYSYIAGASTEELDEKSKPLKNLVSQLGIWLDSAIRSHLEEPEYWVPFRYQSTLEQANRARLYSERETGEAFYLDDVPKSNTELLITEMLTKAFIDPDLEEELEDFTTEWLSDNGEIKAEYFNGIAEGFTAELILKAYLSLETVKLPFYLDSISEALSTIEPFKVDDILKEIFISSDREDKYKLLRLINMLDFFTLDDKFTRVF